MQDINYHGMKLIGDIKDKVCNSLRIPVLIGTCATRRYNYPGTTDTTKFPSDRLQIHQNKLTGFIDRKPVLIAWAKRTIDWKRDGASTNCRLQSWSSRWRSLVCVHRWRSRRWLRDRFFWRLECGVESPRLWSTQDQGSNIAWSEKKAKKPFPSVNNVFT